MFPRKRNNYKLDQRSGSPSSGDGSDKAGGSGSEHESGDLIGKISDDETGDNKSPRGGEPSTVRGYTIGADGGIYNKAGSAIGFVSHRLKQDSDDGEGDEGEPGGEGEDEGESGDDSDNKNGSDSDSDRPRGWRDDSKLIGENILKRIWNGKTACKLSQVDEKIRHDEDLLRAAYLGAASSITITAVSESKLPLGCGLITDLFAQPIIHVENSYPALNFPMRDNLFPEMALARAEYASTIGEFKDNFSALSMGVDVDLFQGLPLVAAGGAVLAAAHRWPEIVMPDMVANEPEMHTISPSVLFARLYELYYGDGETIPIPVYLADAFERESNLRKIYEITDKVANQNAAIARVKKFFGLTCFMHSLCWTHLNTPAMDMAAYDTRYINNWNHENNYPPDHEYFAAILAQAHKNAARGFSLFELFRAMEQDALAVAEEKKNEKRAMKTAGAVKGGRKTAIGSTSQQPMLMTNYKGSKGRLDELTSNATPHQAPLKHANLDAPRKHTKISNTINSYDRVARLMIKNRFSGHISRAGKAPKFPFLFDEEQLIGALRSAALELKEELSTIEKTNLLVAGKQNKLTKANQIWMDKILQCILTPAKRFRLTGFTLDYDFMAGQLPPLKKPRRYVLEVDPNTSVLTVTYPKSRNEKDAETASGPTAAGTAASGTAAETDDKDSDNKVDHVKLANYKRLAEFRHAYDVTVADYPPMAQFVETIGVITQLPVDVANICIGYLSFDANLFETCSYVHPRARALRSFRRTDIDLFLVTRDKDEAIKAITTLYERLAARFPPQTIAISRTPNATTFILPRPYRKIQIIHRLYHSVEQVLLGFDIDCCAVAYDGSRVYTIPRGRRALETHQNIVDTTRQSSTYESRLYKYARRGYTVGAPDLSDLSEKYKQVQTAIAINTTSEVSRLMGLPRLLAMLHVATLGDKVEIHNNNNKYAFALGIVGNTSDYDTFRRGNYKDGHVITNVQKIVGAQSLTPSNPLYVPEQYETARRRAGVPAHCAYGYDIQKVLFDNLFIPDNHEKHVFVKPVKSVVPEQITFETEHPHRQGREASRQLFSGSFQPLTGSWYG